MAVDAIGGRSFGPLLLVAGIIMTSPLSGIPGVPTTMGLLLLLIAIQLLLRKQHCYLPRWLLKRSMAHERVAKAINWLRPAARFIDRYLRPRLLLFVQGLRIKLIAIICIVVAVGLPVMELVPFSAHAAGIALTAFGLALIASDGLLALIAFAVTGGTVVLIVYSLL